MVIFTEGKRVFSSVPRLVGSFGKHELFSRDDLCWISAEKGLPWPNFKVRTALENWKHEELFIRDDLCWISAEKGLPLPNFKVRSAWENVSFFSCVVFVTYTQAEKLSALTVTLETINATHVLAYIFFFLLFMLRLFDLTLLASFQVFRICQYTNTISCLIHQMWVKHHCLFNPCALEWFLLPSYC